MTINFSAQTDCSCDSCGLSARHGFFIPRDDLDDEVFLCTGCAQRKMPRSVLDRAIDDHRSVCFERLEAERKEDEVVMAWLEYDEVIEEPQLAVG
jgi:hypothetical protein